MGFRYEMKLEEEMSKFKRKCSCGHTMNVYPSNGKEFKGYKTCRWCGKRVYGNDELQKQQDERVKKEAFRMNFWRSVC